MGAFSTSFPVPQVVMPDAAQAAPAAGGGSFLDQIKNAVDRDGDGNPLNDLTNLLKR